MPGNDYCARCIAWTGNESLAGLYSFARVNVPFT